MAESFKVGDRVKLTNSSNKDQEGIIRYLGPLEGKEGDWCGIDLEEKKGSHGGQFQGKSYFTCEEGHGLFVREKHISLISKTILIKAQPQKIKEEIKNQEPENKEKIKEISKVKPPGGTGSEQLGNDKKQKVGAPSSSKNVSQNSSSVSNASSKTTASTTSSKPLIRIPPPEKPSSQSTAKVENLDTSNKIKQLEEELANKESEIQAKDAEMQQKELEIQQLSEELERKEEVLQDMSQEVESNQNKLDEKQTDIEDLNQRIKTLEEDLSGAEQKYDSAQKDLLEQKVTIQKLEEDVELLHEALKESEESSHLIESLTIEKENLEHKLDEIKHQLDVKEQENKKLNQEKELAQMELDEAMKVSEQSEEQSGDPQNSEQIKNNARLRQAVQLLSDQLEVEKIESLEKIIELEEKISKMPEMENSIKSLEEQLSTSRKQISELKEEIEELKETLEIHSDAVNMVEKMTDQRQELEEKIMAQKMEIKEFKEMKEINDELIESYQENCKEQEEEISKYEFSVYELKRLLQEKDEQLQDSERQLERLKEKARQYKEQSESFQQEASSNEQSTQNSAGQAAKNIQKLLESQQDLFQQRRMVYKKYIESTMERIQVQVDSRSQQNTYLACIPEQILVAINKEALRCYSNTQKSKLKCNFIINELFSYLLRETSTIIQQENISLFNWIISLLTSTNLFSFYLQKQENMYLNASTNEQLIELNKGSSNSAIATGGSFLDSILHQLKEDNISSKISIEALLQSNSKLQEQDTDNNASAISNIYLRRTIIFLRIQIFAKAFYVRYLGKQEPDLLFKTLEKRAEEFIGYLESPLNLNTLKMQKLVDCSVAIEEQIKSIKNENILSYMGTQKSELKEEIENVGTQTPEELEEREKVNHFRKQIVETANLLSSLNTDADQKLQQATTNHSDTNLFLNNNENAWSQAVHSTKKKLEDMDQTVQNEKKLQQDMIEQLKKSITQEKSIEDLTKIKHTLEQRVVQLQLTSERVAVLEGEKKRFFEKEKNFKEASEIIQKELESTKKKYKEAQEELKAQKPSNSLMSSVNMSRPSLLRQSIGPIALNKQSSSIKGPEGEISLRTSIIQHQQFYEDNSDLVKYLENENNMLRSKDLNERIKSLTSQSDSLQLFKQLKEKDANKSTLTFLQEQVSKSANVHTKGLQLLSTKQIVDLSTLKNKTITEKDLNIQEYLQSENKPIEALRYEAFKICNEISKRVNSTTSFKQRIDIIPQQPSQSLQQIGSITFNSRPCAQPQSVTKLTVSMNDWSKIRQAF